MQISGRVLLCVAVVLVVGCKPLVREPDASLRAVSDGKLTLGMVGIENDGLEAYRLLVCQSMPSYPLHVLEDDSRCRVALLSKEGGEVIFLPNQFQLEFMTKVKGFTKGVFVGSLVIIPAVAIGALAGGWKFVKKAIKMTKEAKETGRKVNFEKLVDDKSGHKAHFFYKQLTKAMAVAPDLSEVSDIHLLGMYERYFRENLFLQEVQDLAASLAAVNKTQKIVEKTKRLPDDELPEFFENLKKEVEEINGGVFDGKNSFVRKFEDNKKKIETLSKQSVQGKSAAEVTKSLETAEEMFFQRSDDVLKYRELFMKATLYKTYVESPNPAAYVEKTDEVMAELTSMIKESLSSEAQTTGIGKVVAVANVVSGFAISAGKGVLVSGGAASAALIVLQKSIWGYPERLLGKHWNQVFITDDDLAEAENIGDMRYFLQVLADHFGYVVNPRAISL